MLVRVSQRTRGSRRARIRHIAAVAAAFALAGVLSPSGAQADESASNSGFFFGTSSGILTLVYTPVKLAYAAASIPVGGLVYVWTAGNSEVTSRVIRNGTRGTFVLTPDHLRGDKDINFMGSEEPEEKSEESDHASR